MAMNAANHAVIMLMLGLLIIALSPDFTVAQIGVAYGRNGDRLPSPSRVVQLYHWYNIKRMRIYEPAPDILRALQCSNIELAVGIQNQDIQPLAESPANADAWVRYYITNYRDVKFRHIVVGNEVSPINRNTKQYVPYVLPAMKNIYNCVSRLQRGIKVTTAVDTEVIDPRTNFPPENGRFRPEVGSYLDPIVRFLAVTGAPLYANIYPYFAYLRNEEHIDLAYALLDPDYPGVVTSSGITYKNLFYAILDALNAALDNCTTSMSLGVANDVAVEAVAGESQWSSQKTVTPPPPPPPRGKGKGKGGVHQVLGDDDVANIENARKYVNNLIQAVKTGTPMRPGKPIETYIFAMFDENLKEGNEEERHFGLFKPDGCPKYPVNFD